MTDLSTNYLGLTLKNPLVAAASPLTGSVHDIQRLEEAGMSAVVLHSMFAEQIEHDELEIMRMHEFARDSSSESASYFPELETYNSGPEPYLDLISDSKKHVDIPIIASLNGSQTGNWLRYARLMELARADALELNVYFVPTATAMSADQVEERLISMVRELASQVGIPFAIKLGPYYTALPNLASRLVAAGASGLVLFNRYLDPEIDLELLRVQPYLQLSTARENRLVVRWLAILRDHLPCSLAASGGIQSIDEVLKSLLAGANVTMLASHLLSQGVEGSVPKLLQELREWLTSHDYQSVKQLIGSMSRLKCADEGAYERASYMKSLVKFSQGQ